MRRRMVDLLVASTGQTEERIIADIDRDYIVRVPMRSRMASSTKSSPTASSPTARSRSPPELIAA